MNNWKITVSFSLILNKIWNYFLEWARMVLIHWPIVILPPIPLLVDCPTKVTVPWHITNTTAEKSAALPPLNITPTFSLHCILLTVAHSWGKTRLFRVQNAGINANSKRVGGQCEIWRTLLLNEVIAIYLSILFIWFLGAQRLFLQISKIPLPSQCDIWSACLECTPGWSHNYRNFDRDSMQVRMN